MVRPKDLELAETLNVQLDKFHQEEMQLPGIENPARRQAFVEQILESIHRVKYVSTIGSRKISGVCTDSNGGSFDPLKAAIIRKREGKIDEAYWFIFLFVHFGKNPRGGWRFAREVYGRLGHPPPWDWEHVSNDVAGFRDWLHENQGDLKRPGVPGGFGNHHKFQSLDARSDKGTGAAVESYVEWVSPPRTHQQMIDGVLAQANGDPRKAFDILYRSMNAVDSFGRVARFDYLCMVGKLGLAPIEPGATYMSGSTGPVDGARLLFGGKKSANLTANSLDETLAKLEENLDIGDFGMQVLEDALCNWQKSPDIFKAFRG